MDIEAAKVSMLLKHLTNKIDTVYSHRKCQNVEVCVGNPNKNTNVEMDNFNEKITSSKIRMWEMTNISTWVLPSALSGISQCFTCRHLIFSEQNDMAGKDAFRDYIYLLLIDDKVLLIINGNASASKVNMSCDFTGSWLSRLKPRVPGDTIGVWQKSEKFPNGTANLLPKEFDKKFMPKKIPVAFPDTDMEEFFGAKNLLSLYRSYSEICVFTTFVQPSGDYSRTNYRLRPKAKGGFASTSASTNTDFKRGPGASTSAPPDKMVYDHGRASSSRGSHFKRGNRRGKHRTATQILPHKSSLVIHNTSDCRSEVTAGGATCILRPKILQKNGLKSRVQFQFRKKFCQMSPNNKKMRQKFKNVHGHFFSKLKSEENKIEIDHENWCQWCSASTLNMKIEKKYPFHPLEEHRPWCSWITEIEVYLDGDKTVSTDKGSDYNAIQKTYYRKPSEDTSLDISGYNTDRTTQTLLGYQFFVQQIHEVLEMAAEPQWSNTEKYSMNLDGIRNIRSMLYDSWTASEANSTDAEDIAEK
ncbi:unnamed protein product, partial [Meganyctiphanes norvegica]